MSADIDTLFDKVKTLNTNELVKVLKVLITQLEKSLKANSTAEQTKKQTNKKEKIKSEKSEKSKSESEKSEKPKGKDHLKKYNAWITFVLDHATNHGWQPFTVKEIEMPGSVCMDGKYYYKDLVDAKTGKPKKMIRKHAMSLTKLYWSIKDKSGSHPELYKEFEVLYANQDSTVSTKKTEEVPVESEVPVKKTVTKKTIKKDTFTCKCKGDCKFHKWSFDGNNYMRNRENCLFEDQGEDTEYNENGWVGVYDSATMTIDNTILFPIPFPNY